MRYNRVILCIVSATLLASLAGCSSDDGEVLMSDPTVDLSGTWDNFTGLNSDVATYTNCANDFSSFDSFRSVCGLGSRDLLRGSNVNAEFNICDGSVFVVVWFDQQLVCFQCLTNFSSQRFHSCQDARIRIRGEFL